MTLIDYVLAEQAELLNAWSVVQRLFGQTPDAGESLVYQLTGAVGELLTVMLFNLFVAGLLAGLINFAIQKRKR